MVSETWTKERIKTERPTLGVVTGQPAKIWAPKKLDIGCGQNKTEGFKGIDLSGDADIKHDLFTYPWPIKAGSVKEVECHHFVEHIPHYRPEYQGQDGWWMFFSELYRICAKDASLHFTHPYSMSVRADWDPTHTRRIHEMTWYYLDRGWRQANGIDHYGTDVDFEVVTINGQGLPDDFAARSDGYQATARTHYWNVVSDLEIYLRKRA